MHKSDLLCKNQMLKINEINLQQYDKYYLKLELVSQSRWMVEFLLSSPLHFHRNTRHQYLKYD